MKCSDRKNAGQILLGLGILTLIILLYPFGTFVYGLVFSYTYEFDQPGSVNWDPLPQLAIACIVGLVLSSMAIFGGLKLTRTKTLDLFLFFHGTILCLFGVLGAIFYTIAHSEISSGLSQSEFLVPLLFVISLVLGIVFVWKEYYSLKELKKSNKPAPQPPNKPSDEP